MKLFKGRTGRNLAFLIALSLGVPVLADVASDSAGSRPHAGSVMYDDAVNDDATMGTETDAGLFEDEADDSLDADLQDNTVTDDARSNDAPVTGDDLDAGISDDGINAGLADERAAASDAQEAHVHAGDPVVAPAVAETRGERPTYKPSNIRLIPAVGAASFTTDNDVTFENFDDGFSAGVFADFGPGAWVFETGILALSTQGSVQDEGASFEVDSWGIPLMAKFNLSGKPRETVFLKLGVIPFQPDGTTDDFDVLGSAGIGGAIPLLQNTALTLEATYNRLLDDTGDLGTYQGVAALVGLQFGL